MTEAGRWIEQGNAGGAFNFVEQSRDDWTVYIFDGSRGVRLQIDSQHHRIAYASRGETQTQSSVRHHLGERRQ